MERLADELFALSSDIRYVAIRSGADLLLRQRPDLHYASSSESDRYEELLVNPTLLTLTGERGRIDCGGVEYVVVRYGNFFQIVHPIRRGHISVAVEPGGDPVALVADIRRVLAAEDLWPVA